MENKKLKVLQVNKLYFPWIGGVERVVQQIAEGLNDSCQMTVLVCQPKGKFREEKVNGVKILRAGSSGMLFSMPVSFSFPFLLRNAAKDSDIIHIHMPFPLADISSILIDRKKKVVIWWHSDIVRQKILKVLLKPFMHMVLKRADRIFVATPNHIESSDVLKRYRDKCTVIHFGIDLKKYELTSEMMDAKNKLRLEYPGKNILFAGRLIYYKGIQYLVDAMKNIDARLLIVGDGPLKKELIDSAKRNDILSKIVFTGKVSEEDLLRLYHFCDLFVLPSIEKTEAFGLVQLEAMACGKPVVSTDLNTGVSYVNRNGYSGYTVRTKDPLALEYAINKLLSDDPLRIQLGANAKKWVFDEFSEQKMLGEVFNQYLELMSK
ncbi:MAG: glycosyltransferase [Candidatus Desantisbacteria bacterium]